MMWNESNILAVGDKVMTSDDWHSYTLCIIYSYVSLYHSK